MTIVLGFLAILMVWIPTLIYPRSHRILQIKINYFLAVLTSLVIVLLYLKFEDYRFLVTFEGKTSIAFIASPLLFLILYKAFNSITQHQYGRNIYFRTKGGSDLETAKSTWLDFVLQLTLGATQGISLLIAFLGIRLISFFCNKP